MSNFSKDDSDSSVCFSSIQHKGMSWYMLATNEKVLGAPIK